MQNDAIIPDIGPAVRDAGKEIAKGIREGFAKVSADVDFARGQRMDGWIQGGLVVGVCLIVVYLLFHQRKPA